MKPKIKLWWCRLEPSKKLS